MGPILSPMPGWIRGNRQFVDWSNAAGGGAATFDVFISIENLNGSSNDDTLIVRAGGTADGGNGNDTLGGDALGQSRETLFGGGGFDKFKLHAGSVADLVTDFNFFTDKIQISRAEFGLSGAVLDGTNIVSQAGSILGNAAKPQFIFEEITQTLYFDTDGNGFGAPVAIAVLPTLGVSLTFAMLDFIA